MPHICHNSSSYRRVASPRHFSTFKLKTMLTVSFYFVLLVLSSLTSDANCSSGNVNLNLFTQGVHKYSFWHVRAFQAENVLFFKNRKNRDTRRKNSTSRVENQQANLTHSWRRVRTRINLCFNAGVVILTLHFCMKWIDTRLPINRSRKFQP